MHSCSRNLGLFHVFYLFKSAAFHRGIFLLFLQHKGFHDLELGTLQATLYLVSFAAEIPTGLLGDRLGRRFSMLAGLALTAATTVAQLLLGGLTPFVVIFALQGVGFACLSGSDSALLYDSLKALGRAGEYVKLRARLGFIAAATLALAMALGGLLKQVSWTAVYVASVIAGLIAIVSVALMREAPTHDAESTKPPSILATLRVFLTEPTGRALLPLVLASGFIHAALTPYFVFAQGLFASQQVSIAGIAVVMALVQVAGGGFGLVAERVAHRLGLRLTFFVTVIALVCCSLLNLLDHAALSIGLFALAMIGPEVLVILIDDHLQQHVPSRARASILSAFSLVEACFTGLGYLLVGALLASYRPATAIAALSSVLLVALVLGSLYFAPRAAAREARGAALS